MSGWRSKLSWLWTALAGFVLVLWANRTSVGFVVNMMLAYIAVFVVSIAVHEAGHAVAATLVRFRVMRIVTGAGPRLLTMNLGRTEFELRLLPLGGATHLASRDPHIAMRGLRLRHFLAVAAGPTATMALAVWATDLVPHHWGVWDRHRQRGGHRRRLRLDARLAQPLVGHSEPPAEGR